LLAAMIWVEDLFDMKAIRVHKFGGPEVLTLEDVAEPRPGPGQVLVRVKGIGVNPVETYIRSGSNPAQTLPYTPGSDVAGEVAARGDSVKGVEVGARVYTSGTVSGAYAEMVLCEAADVHPLPQDISFAQGAALNIPYATAYRALFQRARALPGETVLVHGATGGVGTAAVALARAAGLTVIATAGSPEGAKLVRELGAHHALDHRATDYLDELMKITEGRGVDIILEMLSNVNLGKDLKVLAMQGRVVVIGSRGKVEIDARDAMKRDAEIRAMMLFNATEKEKAGIHAALAAGLANGTLRPVIGRELPLAEASRAHQLAMEAGHRGKIVLVP
jgi:NADPH:quinone reductase